MRYRLYDYVNAHSENEFRTWTTGLQKVQRAKLNARIDKLALHGDDLHPHMLTGTPTPGIQKLRVRGNVELRPLLCKGPIEVHAEYTFLMGATERDGVLVPLGADQLADAKKAAVIADAKNRREEHESVG